MSNRDYDNLISSGSSSSQSSSPSSSSQSSSSWSSSSQSSSSQSSSSSLSSSSLTTSSQSTSSQSTSSSRSTGSSSSVNSSSSSTSTSISSQSQIIDTLLPPYSLVINSTNGNPLVVFPTEKQHVVVEEFDCLYGNKISSKILPTNFSSGNLFISHNEVGQIPFSFESLVSDVNSSQLPFNYNTSFDEMKFFNKDNKNNITYIPPNPKNESNVIVPNSFDSTHIHNVGIEIWPDDMFEIKNIKIGNLYNMSFSDFIAPKDTYNLPSFSWEHNTFLFADCFSALQENGNLTVFKYESDKNALVNVKNLSCVLDSDSLNYGFSNLLYSSKSSNILVTTPTSVLIINGTTLDIINVYNISNVNLYCYDNNGDFWGTINNKNIIKIDSDLNTYTYNTVSNPVKMLFSTYHKLVFILSDDIVYTFNPSTQELKIIDQAGQYAFKDMDIYQDGSVGILSQNKSNSNVSIIKVLNPDLVVKKIFNLSGEKIFQILFSLQGLLFYLSEKDSENFVSYINPDNDDSYAEAFEKANINNNPMFLYYPQSKMFLIFSSGMVYSCSDDLKVVIEEKDTVTNVVKESSKKLEIIKIYSSKDAFYKISYAPRHNYCETLTQQKVRVFVGSKMGQNDRWDSGEIESNKTEILYGGGDNLEQGQKYFVHILVFYKNYGWSNVQIKEFVVPK